MSLLSFLYYPAYTLSPFTTCTTLPSGQVTVPSINEPSSYRPVSAVPSGKVQVPSLNEFSSHRPVSTDPSRLNAVPVPWARPPFHSPSYMRDPSRMNIFPVTREPSWYVPSNRHPLLTTAVPRPWGWSRLLTSPVYLHFPQRGKSTDIFFTC